jgi:DNA-binding transcriptional LysR family regulator
MRKGAGEVFPRVEVRHLHAVVVLAEELNFTRAADRLNITQSGFSKQINEVEALHKFQLFIRTNKKNVELTDVGRIFVEEARLALWHIDRAVQAAREGSDSILTIGHSPDAELAWISALLSIRLPMFPKLRVQLISEFSSELVRRVMAGDLNMALVTAPPESSRITVAAFARTHLYAALPQAHAAAQKEEIAFQDLAKDEWILFARRSHPVVRAAIMDAAQRQGVAPKQAHDILTAQEAIHLVSQHVGVAIVTKPPSAGPSVEGVVIRPLSDPSLFFETCLIMRADEDSRLANDFGRSFLQKCAPRRRPPMQLTLPLPA